MNARNVMKFSITGVSTAVGGVVGHSIATSVYGILTGASVAGWTIGVAAAYGFATYGAMSAAEDTAEYIERKIQERKLEALFKKFTKTDSKERVFAS